MADRFVISCEHGGNRVPERFRDLFRGREVLLASHRGYDLGILSFAERLSRKVDAPLEASSVTRLLVDLNRSLGSPTLFSEITRSLTPATRREILSDFYFPYRRSVEETVGGLIGAGYRVVHLSVHSFTPVFVGEVRNADVGLLYDPARLAEKEFCLRWQHRIREADPAVKVRRNYPYRGTSDSVVTALRRRFTGEVYLGIEIEINQELPTDKKSAWARLQRTLSATLPEA